MGCHLQQRDMSEGRKFWRPSTESQAKLFMPKSKSWCPCKPYMVPRQGEYMNFTKRWSQVSKHSKQWRNLLKSMDMWRWPLKSSQQSEQILWEWTITGRSGDFLIWSKRCGNAVKEIQILLAIISQVTKQADSNKGRSFSKWNNTSGNQGHVCTAIQPNTSQENFGNWRASLNKSDYWAWRNSASIELRNNTEQQSAGVKLYVRNAVANITLQFATKILRKSWLQLVKAQWFTQSSW